MTIPTLPIIAIFVVFILSLAGSLIPPLTAKARPDFDMLGNCIFRGFVGFATGIILAVGFVHSFSDSDATLTETIPWYPWAGVFAMLGAMTTFFVEQVVTIYLAKESKDEAEQTKTKFYTEMWVLLFGLSFHSFFVGLALGLSNDDLALFLAILAHQFFEGLALGFRITRANLERTFLIWVIDLLFASAASAGMVVGIIINQAAGDSRGVEIVDGIFNAFSAGILIYVALVHMLTEESHRPEVVNSRANQITMYTGFVIGAILMSAIAYFA